MRCTTQQSIHNIQQNTKMKETSYTSDNGRGSKQMVRAKQRRKCDSYSTNDYMLPMAVKKFLRSRERVLPGNSFHASMVRGKKLNLNVLVRA